MRPGKPGSSPSAGRASARTRLAWARGRLPSLLALLVALAGVLDLGSVFKPALFHHVRRLARAIPITVAVTHLAAAAVAASGLLLILVARGLRRRKRRAWRAAVLALSVSLVLHLVHGLALVGAVVAGLLLVALFASRREFTAQGDPRTRWRALGVGATLVVASGAVGLGLLTLHSGAIAAPHPFGAELEFALVGLAGFTGPLHFVNPRAADLVSDTLGALGLVTALVVGYLVLRPAEPVARLSPEDERAMRVLLAVHGARDSLGYFALRRDKSVVWSPTGKAAIAYRVVSGTMLASGDPLGDPEAWPGAISAFLKMAADHAWTPAVMGCGELAGVAWGRAGLAALELGDEAVIEVSEFSLEGRAMRNVRQAANRCERAGYELRVRRVADIPAAERLALRTQAAAWRGAPTERGFSMALGRFGDDADGGCVAVTAQRDGRLCAFLHFVPWGPDGLSLDLMRRAREADNGVNELLIVETLREAPGLGVKRVSLNFAVFRSALERGERLGAGPVLRAWRGLLVFASRWFQIESLYRFNAKFQPSWEPRFLCYPAARDLPRIAFAVLEAEAFIVWPGLRFWRRRPEVLPGG